MMLKSHQANRGFAANRGIDDSVISSNKNRLGFAFLDRPMGRLELEPRGGAKMGSLMADLMGFYGA